MSPAAERVTAPSDINYDVFGYVYWNPHPKAKGGVEKEVDGRKYPYGTEIVVVAGRHYVFPPQGLAHIPPEDPNLRLVLSNIGNMIGASSRNDKGIRRLDLRRLIEEGDDYLREVDADASNILLETLKNLTYDNLDRENESRAARGLPKRDFNIHEARMLEVYKGLHSRHSSKKTLSREKELAALREGAEAEPAFAVELAKMNVNQLRKKAAAAGIAKTFTMGKDELIRRLREAVLDTTGASAAVADISGGAEEAPGGGEDVGLDDIVTMTPEDISTMGGDQEKEER